MSTIAFALVVALTPVDLRAQSVPGDESNTNPEASGLETSASSTSSTASENANPSLRQQLERLLSGYHYQPDREELQSLGPSSMVKTTLIEIIGDQALRSSMRLRAVDTLALYEDESVVSFLKDLLERPSERETSDEQTAFLLRHRAIMGLARVLSDRNAVERLERFLNADELQIRLTAIAALGQYAGEPGRERLRTLARSAEHDVVQAELDTYIDLERDASE